MAGYVPRQGDFIAVTFDPQAGHEQRGRRPALVISKDLFNARTGLAIVCPVTNNPRRHPMHVPVAPESGLTGFVMVEQIRSLDCRAREAQRIATADADLLAEVLAQVDACLY
jgi:mRNA interferase MazF